MNEKSRLEALDQKVKSTLSRVQKLEVKVESFKMRFAEASAELAKHGIQFDESQDLLPQIEAHKAALQEEFNSVEHSINENLAIVTKELEESES